MNDKELLVEAKSRLVECIARESDSRKLQLEDLKFSTLDQWPQEIRNARENDPNGAKPCLTIDKINQYIVQVVNDMRKNKPGIKTRPVDSEADLEVADIFMGKIRHIEDISNADISYSCAGESQVRVGEGYFRVVTDYVDSKSFNQEIYIKPIMDRFSVYLGKHMFPDGSDAPYGFLFEDMPLETFKREWPKAKFQSIDIDDGNTGHFCDEKTIRIAEYFYFDHEPTEIVYLSDGQTMTIDEYETNFKDVPDSPVIKDRRNSFVESVKWCKLTGAEILEQRDWLGKYIPIIKVTGKTAIVEGKQCTWGLVRPAMDSLREYNYVSSMLIERLMLQPKTPFIGAVGQFATKASEWARANKDSFAYLEYDAVDVNGMALPAPQRQQAATFESAMVQYLQLIEHDIQTALGMFKASVGQAEPQQSGRAILALQQESDTGTSHFPDNLSISIRHCGRILVDLIPKIYDVAQLTRLLGVDGASSTAEIDPQQQESMRQVQMDDGSIKKIYNLGVGHYDVTVTVGPSYNTKRMEMAEMLMKMNEGDPTFKQIAGDLLFDSMDWPDGLGQKLAERYKKMLPPQLQDKEGGQQAQMQQQMQQMMQQGQQMQQALQELQQENQQLKSGVQEAMGKQQIEGKKAQAESQRKDQELMGKAEIQKQELQLAREKAQEIASLARDNAEESIRLDRYTVEETLKLAREKAQEEARLKRDISDNGVDEAIAKVNNLIAMHESKMLPGEDAIEPKTVDMQQMHEEFLGAINQIVMGLQEKKTTNARAEKQEDGSWLMTKTEA